MAETFSAIVFEYFDTATRQWVNFSSDVLAQPYPQMQGMGIKGFGVTDRVGGIATLTFSLDNSAAGSKGLGGYSGITYFAPGTQVHVYFEYDNIRRYKYFGYVDVNGRTVVSGVYGPRRVDIRCSNIMKTLSDYELDLVGYQTNLSMNKAIELVLNRTMRQPQRMDYNTGSSQSQNFPTVFDITRTNTRAIGEIQKMTFSEFGRVFITGDGTTGETMRTEGYFTRSDIGSSPQVIPTHSSLVTDELLLMATGNLTLMATGNLRLNPTVTPALDDTDWTDFQTTRAGGHTFNYISVNLNPRTVDAAATTVLWNLDKFITLAAGEQKTDIRGEYRDPNNLDTKINGIEMVTPVAGTDYAAYQNSDGTGTNYTSSLTVVATYGTAGVSYSITNNAAVTVYVTLLQARGKGVRIYNINPIVYQYRPTQNTYGILSVDFPMPYIDGEASARAIFGTNPLSSPSGILRNYADDSNIFVESATLTANKTKESMFCFMCLEPGMKLTISETVSGVTAGLGYFIHGYDWTIKPGKIVEWTVNFGTKDST